MSHLRARARVARPSWLIAGAALLLPHAVGSPVAPAGADRQSEVREVGPPGAWPFAIAVDPASPTTVYMGLHGGGVLRSEDAGETWQPRNLGLTDLTVMPVVVDPRQTETVYAGTHVGVFRTTDGARTWRPISEGLLNRDVWSLAIDPSEPSTLYAGTGGGGIFKTRTRGEQWQASGLTGNLVWPIVVDPRDSRRIWAGTIGKGLFRSTDGGDTWSRATGGLTSRRIYALALDPSPPGRIYAAGADGVYMSDDDGASWRGPDDGQLSSLVFSLATHPATPGLVFAGTGAGIFRSRDGGAHWVPASDGLANRIVWPIALDPRRPSVLYAGTLGGGPFKSTSGGESWTAIAGDLRHQVVFSVDADPRESGHLWVGTAGAGVVCTPDGGASWQPRNQGLSNLVVKALALDPAHPGVAYVAAQEQFMGSHGGVFKTIDAGASWIRLAADLIDRRVFSVAVNVNDPLTVYVGTDGGGVFKTTDGGARWADVGGDRVFGDETGITPVQQAMHPRPVHAIAIHPRRRHTVYAGTDSGVFRSLDGGASWVGLNAGLLDRRVRALLVDPFDADTLYVGVGDFSDAGSGGGIFKSTDGGSRWEATAVRNQWVLALTADPEQRGALYAGTSQGMIGTTDGWQSFVPIATGVDRQYVLSLGLDTRGRVLYAGTEGNSLLAVDLPRVSGPATSAGRPSPSDGRADGGH